MTKINIRKSRDNTVINPQLHGQFIEFLGTCISGGIWVGKDSEIPNYDGLRKDVVDALKELNPPVIRWPGGCYRDMYHWRDGIGKERKTTWNENFGTYSPEKNEFSTHEFMKLCELVGAKPWLNINMLRGTVSEMVEWAEYCNRREDTTLSRERALNGHKESFNVEYWGIGNEPWSGGGNYTRQGYSDEYRKYATAMPAFRQSEENDDFKIKLIACGPDGNKPNERIKWTKDFFKAMGEYRTPPIFGYDLHFYNWNIKDYSKKEYEFEEEDWYSVIKGALELEDVIKEQVGLMNDGIQSIPDMESQFEEKRPECSLVIGEWGNWHGSAFNARPALYQQCTMRDAITTALTLDILHRNAKDIKMACAAQAVNVLNSVILTEDRHTILTPNFYVSKMYMAHRGGVLLDLDINTDYIGTNEENMVNSVYAFSSEKDGVVTLNIVNTDIEHTNDVSVKFDFPTEYIEGTSLFSDDVHNVNSVGAPDKIVPLNRNTPIMNENGYNIKVKPASVNVYTFRIAH